MKAFVLHTSHMHVVVLFVFAILSNRAIALYPTCEYIVLEPRIISIADTCGALARVSRTAHISYLLSLFASFRGSYMNVYSN